MALFFELMIAFCLGTLYGYGVGKEERNQLREKIAELEEKNKLRPVRWTHQEPVNCRCSVKVEESEE